MRGKTRPRNVSFQNIDGLRLLYWTKKCFRVHNASNYLSLSRIVCNRWAMVRTVASLRTERIVDWIKRSVSMSIAGKEKKYFLWIWFLFRFQPAVASSRIKILVLRRRARAKHSNCLSPALKQIVQCKNIFIEINRTQKIQTAQPLLSESSLVFDADAHFQEVNAFCYSFTFFMKTVRLFTH